MPFDDPSLRVEIKTNEEEIAIIDQMMRLLANRENWTTGSAHRVRQVRRFLFSERTVHSYCLTGAIDVVTGECGGDYSEWRDRKHSAGRAVHKALQKGTGRSVPLYEYNDKVSHDMVMGLLRETRHFFE